VERLALEVVVSVHVAHPSVLWALAVLPILLLGARRARLAAACRIVAATAIVLALAGVGLDTRHPAGGACVVLAVDVSASVGDAARTRAEAFVESLLPALGPSDVAGAVAFAGRARVVAAPRPHPEATALLPADLDAGLALDDTDLAGAVATAAALCPSDRQPAVVLVSDGNQTIGDVVAETSLMEPRPPVFPLVPASGAMPPATVTRLLVPPLAPARSAVPVAAVVESASEGSAVLDVTVDGQSLPPRPVELTPGTAVVPVAYIADDPGHHRLTARLLLPSDSGRVRRSAGAPLTVTAPRRVLVVAERATPPVAALALARHGADVHVVPPRELVARASDLDAYHAVVLDDVARRGLPDATLAALATWVAGGGALVVTGGPHLFGDAGFVGTPLERVLPVRLTAQTPEPEEREPIALYLLVDRSNSMAETAAQGLPKIAYAKRAAHAVLDQLAASDLVGAIAFDSEAHEVAPLRTVAAGGPALGARIDTLQQGGGTDFLEALADAGRKLIDAPPRVKHVLLLTDGESNRRRADHLPVLAELAAAGVTVTTIKIGDDVVNLDLLVTVARTTGGEFHHARDMETLPQLMIRDTQRQIDASSGHADARARIAAGGPMLAGLDEERLPPVARWAVTRARPDADVRLVVDAGRRRDPLLVTWQYELGRVAVLPVDFDAGASAWAVWPGFGALWTQLVDWAAPHARPSDRRLVATRQPAGVLVTLDVARDEAGPFALRLAGSEVTLAASGRRRFSAVVPDLERGLVSAMLVAPGGVEEPTMLAVPDEMGSGREGRAVSPDVGLLDRVAALTGGRMDPQPADVITARGGTAGETLSLLRLLIPLALAAIVGDVALRRQGR
jgi:Mg-chelatase subunit ChlD